MKLSILYHPDPRLKKICAPVTGISNSIQKLANDMLETMYSAPGIGLAAPQIGVLSRIIVMDCEKDEKAQAKPIIMFNPELTDASEELNTCE